MHSSGPLRGIGASVARVSYRRSFAAPAPPPSRLLIDDSSSGIHIVDITYSPPGTQTSILRGVSLALQPGEFVAVLGHNGSGKSTLARHINGLLLPEAGSIIVDGLSTANRVHLPAIRRRVGMIFQNPDHQIVGTSVAEDVLWGMPAHVPPSEARARLARVLAAVGLEGYEDQPTWRLSGGQKQRLALAGVLAREPRYLVCDEPTALLDGRSRAEARELLLDCHRRGLGLLWITHRIEEALLADRILILVEGTIAISGSTQELLARGTAHLPSPPPLVQAALRLRALGIELDPLPRSTHKLAVQLAALLDRAKVEAAQTVAPSTGSVTSASRAAE